VPSTESVGLPLNGVSAYIGGPDPRPSVVQVGDHFAVAGVRCTECSYPVATAVPWCPKCHKSVAAATFGPYGTVWGSTVLHVPVPGNTCPFTLAYVDLDNGPRVLAHFPGDERIPALARARLTAATDGQVHAEAVA
jgi:hypothetical protein